MTTVPSINVILEPKIVAAKTHFPADADDESSASLVSGADYEVEFRLKRADGEYRWHSGLAAAGRDADGNIIKWFGTNTDIDDKKSAEKTRRESEEKFRSFIETTKDWIWEIDADGNSIYNNPAVEMILGYTPEELDGKSFLPYMMEEDRAEIERMFPRFISERRGWTNLVCRWRRKDGDILYLESSAVPVFDDGGVVVGFRGTDHDITESKRAEEKLRDSEAWLKAILDGSRDGIELSSDDFGTGYSSLSYLHRLPVSFLKIDRSFVMRMAESIENEEIVHTIIKLAQNLKMRVIAEGIETAEQLAQLRHLNCEFGQGYFFSKPLEAENAQLFIEQTAENFALTTDQPIINLDLNM